MYTTALVYYLQQAQVDDSCVEETMKSSAAHLYIISASSVTIK
jgi:hypothetical protein